MGKVKLGVLLVVVFLGACARSDDGKSAAALNKYSIHGEIMRLNAQDKTATIHHKDIDGFMKSMTMTFPIKDPQEFSALQVGNCIEGTLFDQGDNLWIGDIKHLDLNSTQCVPPPADQK
jgi:Cu/Ag efflux protein CusF